MIMVDRCKRCKRVIKNPTSVIHGYGPMCWKKVLSDIAPKEVSEQNQEPNGNVYMSIK
jgi:hypothetical protein